MNSLRCALRVLQLHESGADPTRPDRLTPAQQLVEIAHKTQRMVAEQYRCWNESLLPARADEGIRFGKRAIYRESISILYNAIGASEPSDAYCR